MASVLAKDLPNCCLNFKRRKSYPQKSQFVGKFWLYCSIAGCSLDSTAVLLKSRQLLLNNKITKLRHIKGQEKSFRSRFVRGKKRLELGEIVSNLSFPSKEYHQRLAALQKTAFQAGNLKDTPLSKNVLRQCGSDFRQSTMEDKDAMKSIQILREKFITDSPGKSIHGFIQFFSINPFTVAMWNEGDIELYHRLSSNYSLIVDATGSISTKIGEKEIFYFAFLSYDRSVRTEPVPHLEIPTELSTTHTSFTFTFTIHSPTFS